MDVRRIWPRIGRMTALACLVCAEAPAADKVTGKLSVRDALTMPGRPVTIDAMLVQESLFRQTGMGGELIEFQIGGKNAGGAMTGGDGRARLEYTPHMRGNLRVSAKLSRSTRVESSEAHGTLFAWERRRPILLVELNALIDEPNVPALPLPSLPGNYTPPTPLPNAAEELKRLTEYFFNVVYVSRAKSHGMNGENSLEWLRQREFPSGPVISIKAGKEAIAAVIDDLRNQGWDNLKSGVGRTAEFAEVLIAHRMNAIVVPEPDRGQPPKKAQIAKGWKEVRKKLQG